MSSWLTRSKMSHQHNVNFKILVLGNKSAGKSAIVEFICGQYSRPVKEPLQGLSHYVHFDLSSDQSSSSSSSSSSPVLTFQLCDHANHGSVGDVSKYSAIVVVIDATDKSTHCSIFEWINFIIVNGNVCCVPMVLANKIDLLRRGQTKLKTVETICKQYSIMMFKTSALTGANLCLAINTLMIQIVRTNLRVGQGQLTYGKALPSENVLITALPPITSTTRTNSTSLYERWFGGSKKKSNKISKESILHRLNRRHFV